MTVSRAMDQLSEIRNHLSRSEMYRGYRPGALAAIGLVSLLFMVAQALFLGPEGRLTQWIIVAIIIAAAEAGIILWNYFRNSGSFYRMQTRRILFQFFPFIISGALLSFIFLGNGEVNKYLPGIWAIIFGLSIVGMLPYITAGLIYAALYYLACGFLSLALARGGHDVLPWGPGLTFGPGHLLTALIMKINLGKTNEDR